MASYAAEEVLQQYLAKYGARPRTPDQLCAFARHSGQNLTFALARRVLAATSTSESPQAGTSSGSSASASSPASPAAVDAGGWLRQYSRDYGHAPSSAQQLCAFATHRGGSLSFADARLAMGETVPQPIPESSRFPWLQDLFALNQHYRTLATMIFARLDMQQNFDIEQPVSAPTVSARLPLQDIARLMALAKPATVQEGFECSICLSAHSPCAPPKWVQLPCLHVFHRSCYRELVQYSCFNLMLNCRCPLCRLDLWEALNQAHTWNSSRTSRS
mmetsp:Transcript_36656/g.86017  ORF Transcript_36656/g.86017 Transcript_36656/m.86017 type:complete len:274 (+) Transcript_36656:55-876(+)